MRLIDPADLAKRQLERDRRRVLFPGLLDRKIARMQASPLAFLRGSAPLFYEILKAQPRLAEGPEGEGWITGDLHLENFGAFRSGPQLKRSAAAVVFNLNDFDEACQGPWRLDVLRLLTSLLLGVHTFAMSGLDVEDACNELLEGYRVCLSNGTAPQKIPRPVRRLLIQVRRRSHRQLLDSRTQLVGGALRFIRGDRYEELTKSIRDAGKLSFARYVESLPPQVREDPKAFEVLDLAFRVAGTGSLGSLRIAVLVRGRGGRHGAWLFDMKEEGVPSATILLGRSKIKGPSRAESRGALRVATAMRSCLAHLPRMIGTTRLGTQSLFVRRLEPQEDKLDLKHLQADDLAPVGRYLGGLAAVAHLRGALRRAPRLRSGWTATMANRLMESAIILAGLHEAAYLHYCRLTGKRS